MIALFVQDEQSAMNEVQAMEVFVRVAELASFTRAADSLGLPKASVSTAVAQLETALGARLLQRTTRRVDLTQDGRAFYERCKELLSDMDELLTMFQQTPQALRGRLRVDMPSPMARNSVIPRLPEFIQAHPQLEVELSSTDRLVDLVREGFDCVVRVGALGDGNMVARTIGHYAMANYASPDYLRRYGTPRELEDLAQHKLIHYASSFGQKPFGFEYPGPDGGYLTLAMPGALTVNNTEAYEAACVAGLGLIQAPASGLQHHFDQRRLVEVLPQYRAEPMPVSLLYANRRGLPVRVQVFMSWMTELLKPQLT